MKRLLLILISLPLATLTFAAAPPMPMATPVAAGAGVVAGWYVGLGAGYGGMDTPKISSEMKSGADVTGYSEDIQGFVASAYGGYLWDCPKVQNLKYGLEVGYDYYPDNKYQLRHRILPPPEPDINMPDINMRWRYEGYNVHLLGVLRYNVAQSQWNIFAKAGAAYASQKYTFDDTQTSMHYSKKRNSILPKVVAGVGYDFTPHIGVNVMGEYVFGHKPVTFDRVKPTEGGLSRVAPIYKLLLGITYHF
jgi:outer membrane autotransporter protein